MIKEMLDLFWDACKHPELSFVCFLIGYLMPSNVSSIASKALACINPFLGIAMGMVSKGLSAIKSLFQKKQ